jgi:hypothetical protein
VGHISVKPPEPLVPPDDADIVLETGPWHIAIGEPGWAGRAVDFLGYGEDVIVDGVFIRARSLCPRRPVWGQLRARLRAAGVRCPREVPQ